MHGIMTDNEKYMSLAVFEAKKRLGRTEPNPAVGAVVVRNGSVLSKGFHWGAGHPHAEVQALSGLSENEIKGATLYVTLEPCCHFGRTPPCTDLILKSGIKKVVFGALDLNPVVQGRGVEKLIANKVEIEQCKLKEIDEVYHGYSWWWKTKRPFVTLKIALSKDGKMAAVGDKRVKLTCEETDIITHQLRLESSAILTTAATVNFDDPFLDCRLVSAEKKKVFVVDRSHKLKKTAKIFHSANSVTVLEKLDFEELAKEGLHTLWVEAGPRFSKALLESQSVDRLIVYFTPVEVGEGIEFNLSEKDLSGMALTKTFQSKKDLVKVWDRA